MLLKLVVAESMDFCEEAKTLLREHFDVSFADLDRAGLEREMHTADILWVRLRNHVDDALMEIAPALKAVVTNTTGLNHIDLEAAERRGIKVISLRGETEFLRTVRGTAELTVALILSLMRNIPAAFEHVRDGRWDRDQFLGSELYGKTISVIGYGRLGRIVAKYLRAFDVQVVAVDPDPSAACDAMDDGVPLLPLAAALERADIVSLHVDYSPANAQMFGAAEFSAMKPGARFVNTARGELVDETALLEALRSGHIGGAALDVINRELEPEIAGRSLIQYARENGNLLLTPHIGGNTRESRTRTEYFLASRLVSFAKQAFHA